MDYLTSAARKLALPAATPTATTNSNDQQVFQVTDEMRTRRFLCLGSGGNMYTGTPELTMQNCASLQRMIEQGDGVALVGLIALYSMEGRAAKQSPGLFALALCITCSDAQTSQKALQSVSLVARTASTFFELLSYIQALRPSTKMSRPVQRCAAEWYLSHDLYDLAYLFLKYPKRNGWSHADVLRLCHVRPPDSAMEALFGYMTRGTKAQPLAVDAARTGRKRPAESGDTVQLAEAMEFLAAVRALHKLDVITGIQAVCAAILKYKLVHEQVPTKFLAKPDVWLALLPHMPLTALLRNLGRLTKLAVFTRDKAAAGVVAKRLRNVDALRKARVHPYNVLLAHYVYAKGSGVKGKLTWAPEAEIICALEDCFKLAFQTVEPVGKRILLALDVSGSMAQHNVLGGPISCRTASAAMAMVTAAVERNCDIMGFMDAFVPLPGLLPSNTLRQNEKYINGLDFGPTDCALPITWAMQSPNTYDVFVVFTDSETTCSTRADRVLQEYRRKKGVPNAKLIVVGMAANEFTIADPADPNMLDIAGFDAAAPKAMSLFMAE